MESIGARIGELRKRLDITMDEFGSRVGVTKAAISNVENDKRNLSDQMAKLICSEFNVSEEWLRNGTGEMFVTMSRDEEIAAFIGKIQMNDDDSFKKRFIAMLSALSEDEWEVLENIALKLSENKKD